MEHIKVNYRDIEITYNEDYERWGCQIDDGKWTEKQTLKECKKAIDIFYKKQVENIVCIYVSSNSYGKEFGSKLFITSVNDNDEIWVKDEKGKREKMSKKYAGIELALYNEHNLKIAEEYKEQLKVIESERQNAKSILSKLERLSF